jgi:hypothetical protein
MPRQQNPRNHNSNNRSPILVALQSHRLTAEVTDLDLYRAGVGLLSVETDYIVTVKSSESATTAAMAAAAAAAVVVEVTLEPFCLSKSYHQFRSLASQLKRAADSYTSGQPSSPAESSLPREAIKCAKYCELVSHLVESQKTQYLGKVHYAYAKALSKQRSRILNDVLDATCSYFPDGDLAEHPLLGEVASIIETFFLTDHCDPTTVATPEEQPTPPPPSKHTKKLSLDSQNSSQPLFGAVSKELKGLLSLGMSNRNVSPSRERGGRKGGGGGGSKQANQSVVVQPLSTKARRSDELFQEESKEGPCAAVTAPAPEAGAAVPSRPRSSSFSGSRRHQPPVPAVVSATKKEAQRVPTTISSSLRAAAASTPWGIWFASNPTIFLGASGLALYFVYAAGERVVSVDGDVALLTLFAAFCLGLHLPRPPAADHDLLYPGAASSKPAGRRSSLREDASLSSSARRLYKRMSIATTPRASVIAAAAAKSALLDPALVAQLESEAENEEQGGHIDEEEEEAVEILGSPLPLFPPGAKIGSHTNCYSEPDPGNFQVRGPNYFVDRKKIGSDEFLFPSRGIDLFLTDACPENVGSNSSVFGGNLRDEPTFIVNFRLPWGVLVFYFRIPDRFLPFVVAGQDPSSDKSKLPPLDKMSPGERTVCRFLLGDTQHKNETLKIVPVVVDGPWVVKSVVGGKKARVGASFAVAPSHLPHCLPSSTIRKAGHYRD